MTNNILKWFLPYVLVQAFQYPFAKDSLAYASPYVIMAVRFLSVSLILIAIAKKIEIDKDTIKTSILFSLGTLFWILGLQYVSVGDSAVLGYTMPLFAIPIASIFAKETPLGNEILGAIIGFSGVILYSLDLSHGSALIGLIFTLLFAVFNAFLSVYYRKLKQRDTLQILASQFLIGSVPFIIGSALFPVIKPTYGLLIDLAYLVTFGGVVLFFLWIMMFKMERVAKVTTLSFAVPIVVILIQSVEERTLPTWGSIIGAFVIFLGILISTKRPTPKIMKL